jgi:hypothetical protein
MIRRPFNTSGFAAIAAAVLLASCSSEEPKERQVIVVKVPPQDFIAVNGITPEARAANEGLMKKLTKNCAGCHAEGSNKPFFASIAAFESLLVYNASYIKPGSSEESELIRLLEGQGKLTYKQMPPGGDSFAALAGKGQTDISLDDVKAFIRNLKPRQLMVATADPNATTVRRLDARRIRTSLVLQLGIDPEFPYGDPQGEKLLLRDSDTWKAFKSPADYMPDNNAYNDLDDRWKGLGGASYLRSTPPNGDISSALMLNLAQLSQNWCRQSVRKVGSPLFKFAKPTDGSKDKAADVRKNLRSMMVSLLALQPSDAQVEDLYSSVFLTYEKVDIDTAWTASCSALIRHPLWLSY